MILTDDQGWGDLSINGNTNLSTPRIDSLARDGATFDRFYVSPVCSPTRAEMLTGRYYTRTGVSGVSAGAERLNVDESTMADSFKAAGYATGAFGKWHNGMQWPYHPNARGFDEYYGFCSGHWGYYFSPELEHNGRLVRGNGYITDDLTDHAIKFIEENRDQPFLCYIPLCTPHSPMQVPDEFWNTFDGKKLALKHQGSAKEDIGHTRAALAMCENIDWNVGRVLDKLDQLGLAKNTIVIYFSDNGPNGWRWNDGMKGKKGHTDEGGVRSPFFIRWPNTIKSGITVPNISGAIDLLPTLTDLCDIPIVGKKPLDGVSLKPLLDGVVEEWPERMIFSRWGKRSSVRTQQYRLSHNGRLYDMIADPKQTVDVSSEHPGITAQLKRAVKDWEKEAVRPSKARPFTVGHRGTSATHLPARDGRPHGNIKRSSPHRNCSFFRNWRDRSDYITWDVEVLNSGTYEAEVRYTCKKNNVGAVMELDFGGETVRKTVTEHFDPPLRGEIENRVPTRESYVKDWKTLTLGNVTLAKQTGTLTLRATKIPGSEAIDVRYVILRRL